MSLGLLIVPFVTWSIAASTVAAMFIRPRRIPEAVWACLGAGLLLALRLIPFNEALGAVTKGYDVYLFLTGMMVLAELARREGVFDWLAGVAIRTAGIIRVSRKRYQIPMLRDFWKPFLKQYFRKVILVAKASHIDRQ
jgi:hypothetical protein